MIDGMSGDRAGVERKTLINGSYIPTSPMNARRMWTPTTGRQSPLCRKLDRQKQDCNFHSVCRRRTAANGGDVEVFTTRPERSRTTRRHFDGTESRATCCGDPKVAPFGNGAQGGTTAAESRPPRSLGG